MRYLSVILVACVALCPKVAWTPAAQVAPIEWWVKWNGEWTVPRQRNFASKCYEFGRQYGRGHTLAQIAKMESSFGVDITYSENTARYFGLSKRFIATPIDELSQCFYRIKNLPVYKQLASADRETFEGRAILALCVFEDNVCCLKELGLSEQEAWFWAYPKYCAGNNWRDFKAKAVAFNNGVRYLKGMFV